MTPVFEMLSEPQDLVARLVRAEACEPSLSLFMPTQRRATEARQNRTRFRNLVRDAGEIMAFRRVEKGVADALLRALENIAEDETLWTRPAEGLAVFASPSAGYIAKWPIAFGETVFVDRRFHILPLLEQMEGDDTFYHLTLTRDIVHLTHGNRLGWEDVPLVLDDPSFRAHLSHFERSGKSGAASKTPLSAGKISNRDDDHLEPYLRAIAAAVSAQVREMDRPLVLSGDETMTGLFRKIADEKHFHPIVIAHHADILNESEAHRQALTLLAPTFEAPLRAALERRDEVANAREKAFLRGIENVVRAARAGMIDTLFVPEKSEAFGYFWPERDEVKLGFVPESRSSEDLMNTAAIFTLRHGGKVFALPPKDPRQLVAQAILRHAA